MRENFYTAEDRHVGGGVLLLCAAELIGIAVGSFGGVQAELCDLPKSLAVMLAVSFISGLCALGQPFGIAVILAVGAELGALCSGLYSAGGISALPETALLTVSVSVTAVTAVREVLRSSAAILKCIVTGTGDLPDIRLYCLRFLVLSGSAVVISALTMIK